MSFTDGFMKGYSFVDSIHENRRRREREDILWEQQQEARDFDQLAAKYSAIAMNDDGTYKSIDQITEESPDEFRNILNHPRLAKMRDVNGKTVRIKNIMMQDGPLQPGVERPLFLEAEWVDPATGEVVSRGPITDNRTNDPGDLVTPFTVSGLHKQMVAEMASKNPVFAEHLRKARGKTAYNNVIDELMASMGAPEEPSAAAPRTASAPPATTRGIGTPPPPVAAAEPAPSSPATSLGATAPHRGMGPPSVAETKAKADAMADPVDRVKQLVVERRRLENTQFDPTPTPEEVNAAAGLVHPRWGGTPDPAKLQQFAAERKAKFESLKAAQLAAIDKDLESFATPDQIVAAVKGTPIPPGPEKLGTSPVGAPGVAPSATPAAAPQVPVQIQRALENQVPPTTPKEIERDTKLIESIAPVGPGIKLAKVNRKQLDALVRLHKLNPEAVSLETLARVATTGRMHKRDLSIISDGMAGYYAIDTETGLTVNHQKNPDYVRLQAAKNAPEPLKQRREEYAYLQDVLQGIFTPPGTLSKNQVKVPGTAVASAQTTMTAFDIPITHPDLPTILQRAHDVTAAMEEQNSGWFRDNPKFESWSAGLVASSLNIPAEDAYTSLVVPSAAILGKNSSTDAAANTMRMFGVAYVAGISKQNAFAVVQEAVKRFGPTPEGIAQMRSAVTQYQQARQGAQ